MRRSWHIPLVVSFVLTLPGTPLHAQWRLTGDAGLSRVAQARLPESNAVTLGGTAETFGERTAVRASALGAHTADERSTGQLLALGAFATPRWNNTQFVFTGAG